MSWPLTTKNSVMYASDASEPGLSQIVGPAKLPTFFQTGSTVCDWQPANGSYSLIAGVGASAALDTGVKLFDKPTVKCTFSTNASDTFIATFTLSTPICLRDVQTIQVPLLFTNNQLSNGGVGATTSPFQVWITASNGAVMRLQCRFEYLQSGVWTTLSFDRATAYVTNSPLSSLDAAGVTVTSIKLVQASNSAAANSAPVWVGEIRADVAVRKGRVSIVMDGEYTSQYSLIYPIMKTNSLRSSLALVTANVGTSGCMTEAQITEMYQDGHEIINHTYDAAPGTGATKTGGYGNASQWPTAADIAEDIRAQWAYFKSKGWNRGIGYGVWGYTYGYDPANSTARQALVTTGLKSANVMAMRKSVGYAGESNAGVIPPLTKMPVDPFVVCGSVQITSTTTAAMVKSCIDQAELTGQWVIITVHRAVLSAPGSLEMTVADFQDWMGYLKTRIDAGAVLNAPFGETFNTFFN